VKYASISIYSQKSEFNVEQTLVLEARALTDKGDTVILGNNDVDWSSSNTSYVTMNGNIATAVARGIASVSVTLKQDTSFTNSTNLTVDKDKYIRLFKGTQEVAFPYSASETNTTLVTTLSTFTLRAVGESITIRTLYVKDFDGNLVSPALAYFDNLAIADTINADSNRTYYLKQNGFETKLDYYFDINTSSSFRQTYEQTN
jgi:hypothetical protein